MPQRYRPAHDRSPETVGGRHAGSSTPELDMAPDRSPDYRLSFRISGMNCADEVEILRREVGLGFRVPTREFPLGT